MAKRLTERIDISAKRARVLARTEVIRARADATLNSNTEAGLEGVTIESEFSSVDDNKRCPTCTRLEGSVHTIKGGPRRDSRAPKLPMRLESVIRDPSGVLQRQSLAYTITTRAPAGLNLEENLKDSPSVNMRCMLPFRLPTACAARRRRLREPTSRSCLVQGGGSYAQPP